MTDDNWDISTSDLNCELNIDVITFLESLSFILNT